MDSKLAQSECRVLALEIRPAVTGFVVFEGRERLLDWGMRKYRARKGTLTTVMAKKMNMLVDSYRPSVVAVRARDVRSHRARRRIDAVMRVIRGEAKRRAIRFQIISTAAIRVVFAPHHRATKQEIATLIARWFPELSPKLPPLRKSWKAEDHRMILFDAAATALAFLNRSPPEAIREMG